MLLIPTRSASRFAAAALLVLLIGLATAAPAQAQVLQQVEQQVSSSGGGSQSSSSGSNSRNISTSDESSNDPGDSSDNDDASGALVACGLAALAVPYWAPIHFLDDDLTTGYFLRYPYWNDMSGSMFIPAQGGQRYRQWDGEAAIEYSNDLDDLSRIGAHLRISTTSRFDFETNWNEFTENTSFGRDHLTLGDFDVLFRFAQSDVVQFRSGLGANWLDDHQGIYSGFNFRYGVEWYPSRPWVVKSLVDLGEIGKAGMVHARLTVGALWHRWEIYTGYDFRQIGDVRIDGPVAGLQFRF